MPLDLPRINGSSRTWQEINKIHPHLGSRMGVILCNAKSKSAQKKQIEDTVREINHMVYPL